MNFVRENRPSGLPGKEWAWVYLVTCVPSGKQYVGITGFSVRRRWRRHCNRSEVDKPRNGNCPALHAAIRKYGEDNFTCEAIYAGSDWEAALVAEMALIITLGTKAPGGYNVTDGGEGVRGTVFSEAEIKRRSESSTGRVQSVESRKKRSESLMGHKHTEEAKIKMRAHVKTSEHRANMSAVRKGKKKSPEAIERIRLGHIGLKHTSETRAKMSAWQVGRKRPPETIERMRASALANAAAKRLLASE